MTPRSEISERIDIDVRLAAESRQAQIDELRRYLTCRPPRTPARYFYDDVGSELFERITETDEYYQTRAEFALLEEIADQVVARTSAGRLVELGSGASRKTRALLDAMQRADNLELFVPYDVNQSMVERVADEMCLRYPSLHVHGVVENFVDGVGTIPGAAPRLVIFLGGTIGNFEHDEARRFLADIGSHLQSGDFLLLGTDLIKDARRLEAAYDDSQGLTALFNRNILQVLNDEFGANFAVDRYRHRAIYDTALHRIEMHLIPDADQVVRVREPDLTLGIPASSHILTEISVKYDRALVEALLSESGFELDSWYTAPGELFALSLARRV